MLNYVFEGKAQNFFKMFFFLLHVHELSGRTAKKALLADSPIQGIGLQKILSFMLKQKKGFFVI